MSRVIQTPALFVTIAITVLSAPPAVAQTGAVVPS
jgi:hypothetical protein